MTDLTSWTLDRLTTKIQRDLELHAEIFVQPEDIKSFINDAIDDAEELIIDSFSDYFITFQDYTVAVGDNYLDFPDDIYEMRTRGLYYDKQEYNQDTGNLGTFYKVKKLPLESVATVQSQDFYQYRNVNSQTDGPRIYIYPNIREGSTGRFRLWYIREAARLSESLDVLERGLRPQYIISHAKVSILQKEGSDLLTVEMQRLEAQTKKMLDSLSRVSDDDEDSYLRPDAEALFDAYGDSIDNVYGY